jgi:hypothetical protein
LPSATLDAIATQGAIPVSLKTTLFLSLSGPDAAALARGLHGLGWLPPELLSLEVDFKNKKPGTRWLNDWVDKAAKLTATTNEGHSLVVDRKAGLVALRRPQVEINAGLFEALKELPFELATVGQVHVEWWDETYPAYSFGDGHVQHGWACGFRGAGHERLVSRRWLDFGPWRKQTTGDTSWVEFHDLAADAKTALLQAQPGWERMGISDSGGFIQSGFIYTDDVGGVYDAEARKLKLIVPASAGVSQRKMLEMAAVRRDPRIQRDMPIDRIAFIFVDEAKARLHLHELWLREHECWAIVEGQEVRLDAAYAPQPAKPDWA